MHRRRKVDVQGSHPGEGDPGYPGSEAGVGVRGWVEGSSGSFPVL